MNVLVIADHLFANSLVEEIHNRSGNFSFRLVECRYYAQGIERLGREPLDLVLLDLGSSEETFLKVQEQAGEVPILVITTKDNRDAAQDALNLGARDSLFKEDLEAELVVRAMRYTIERRWMELELRASEERSGILSSLMRNFAFSVLVEPDGRPVVEWITGAFTEITGYTAETLELGKSWKNLVAVEDRSCFDEHTRVLEEGEPHTVRFRFKTKDGGLRWIQIHSRAEIGEGTGRIVRVYGAGLDVSESKKLEHQLSEAKERYAGIFEGVSDAILMEDRRGNLLDANASACKLFGYLRKDLLTKKISDLIPKESSLLLADDTQELRQKIPGHPIEVTITTAGGEQIPAEVNISPYTVGFETVTLLVVRDISQRKQAEEAYRTLVERSLQELYIVQDGKIVFANQAAMRNTGYTLEELKDGLFEEVLSGIYGSDTGSLLGVSAPGRSRREFKRVRKDGQTGWVTNLVTRIQYNGQPALQVAVMDITDRVQAESAYRTLVEQSLQEFLILQGGRLVFANPAALENSGYSLEEMLSFDEHSIEKLVFVEDAEHFRDVQNAILEGESVPARQEFRMVNKEGMVRWVEALCTRVEYQGLSAIQFTQFDITERKRAEENLRYRTAIEALVTNISMRFINLAVERIDAGVRQALEALGRFAKADRSYVCLLSSDWSRFDDCFEWTSPGIEAGAYRQRGKSFEPYQWTLMRFKSREVIHVQNVGELPEQAEAEKQAWTDAGVQSALAIPLIMNNMLFGYWGFDAVRNKKAWSDEDIRLLRLMGDVFVNAMARKQSEQALRAARRELDQLMNSVSDALWTAEVEPGGKLLMRYVSPVIETIFGRSPDYFKSSPNLWINLIYPEDRPLVETTLEQLWSERSGEVELEYRIVLPDGGTRWVRDSQNVRQVPNGNVRLDGVVTDITERKQAEERLHQRFAIEELVASLSTSFINISTSDVDAHIKNALESIGGFTGVDHCYLDLFSPEGDRVERSYEWASGWASVRDNDSVGFSLESFQWSMAQLKRFEVVYVPRVQDLPEEAAFERSFWKSRGRCSVLNIPLVLNDTLAGYFGFSSDHVEQEWAEEDIRLLRLMGDVFISVLARKQAEEALMTSEAQYRLLADSISDIVALHEPDGTIEYVSPSAEKVFGMQAKQLVGSKPERFICAEDWKTITQQANTHLMKEEDIVVQWRYDLDGEDPIWLESSIHLIVQDGHAHRLLTTSRNINERKEAEQAVNEANQRLKRTVVELEKHNQEVVLLNELGDLLQGCLNTYDVYDVIAAFGVNLFPGCSGAIYAMTNSRHLVEAACDWGATPITSELVFKSEDCWALRRGRMHMAHLPEPDVVCVHVHQKDNTGYACIPMIAHGETLGLFYLECPDEVYDHRYKQLTVMVAERVALALANLKLRESLQRQSIHDSLTGLFNRRYMETTLEREIRQAARKKEKIGLIMIDIDHFKQFNDQYGHAGGDKLLASVGEFLLRNVRAGDIACRYGGDEIILILPQANLDDSYQRAEMLREGIRHLLIDYQNTPLGQITASMGVASYPEHGDTLDPLLSAADGALYQAKEHGRDRVVVAPVLAKNEKK